MKLALIVAMTRDRLIGKDGRIPWHVPDDLKFFKRITLGNAVIMGRKTFDSIGRPLPGRRNVVISRSAAPYDATMATPRDGRPDQTSLDVVPSLDAALALCRARGEQAAFVIGGAQIYALALPLADELFITRIEGDYEGDTWFPPFELSQWQDAGPADAGFPAAHRYVRP